MNDPSLYKLQDFNKANFANALENKWVKAARIQEEKYQFRVLFDYLSKTLRVKTILIEKHHLSRSFLNDYIFEYNWGFNEVEKLCKRLHFFIEKIDDVEALWKNPKSNSTKKLWKSYQGFITIKPLPNAKLGTVLLSAPPNIKNKEENWAIREYDVVLLGQTHKLTSLAFQEQDELHNACATVALWAAIHMLHKSFKVALVSPNSINHRAHILSRTKLNYTTNVGLDLNQICSVIQDIGLSSLVHIYDQDETKDKRLIRKIIYAYSKMKLPILMGLKLHNAEQHLITIVGFEDFYKNSNLSLEDTAHQIAIKNDGIETRSDGIETLFAHDDQTGPFTKVKLLNPDGDVQVIRWEDKKDKRSFYAGKISNLIIPLPKNVSISFEDVFGIISSYFVPQLNHFAGMNTDAVWDIYLTQSSDYKSQINGNHAYYNDTQRKQVVEHSFLPPYLWVARGYSADLPFIEFVFNATAIPSAHNYCIGLLFLNAEAEDFIKQSLNTIQDNFSTQKELNAFFEAPTRKTNIWELIISHLIGYTQKFGLAV